MPIKLHLRKADVLISSYSCFRVALQKSQVMTSFCSPNVFSRRRHCSDGRVVRAFRLGSSRLRFDSKSGRTNDFNFWYSQLPCLTFSIKGTAWRTSRQVYLLYRWERHLVGFPPLGVVDRWPATPKRARTVH